MPLPPGRVRAFEAAGKQGCACVAWSRKRRSVFISRQGVYESPRPSSHAPTCGQSVPKLWPHSRKSSGTACNRQGWNERAYTRPWPPPTVPLNKQTRRPIPQSAWPHSLSFWSILFLKIEMGGKPFCGFAISPINWELLCKTLYFSIFYYEQCCKYNFKNKHH